MRWKLVILRLRDGGGHQGCMSCRVRLTRSSRTGRSALGLLLDRKSTRLNSSHANISYAVFCLKKKKTPVRTYTYPATPAAPRPARGRETTYRKSRLLNSRYATISNTIF